MVRILDCTLRDGSHINNGFSQDCILETIKTAEISGIDFIEAGYKMPECLKSSKSKIGIMVDAKNFSCSHSERSEESYQLLFQNNNKMADFVRVACYPEQIKTAINAVENFKEQGFGVFLHLMTADKFSDYKTLENWKNKNILESVYFADSFGAFMPDDVETIYKKLQDCGFENISFHAHNNLQLAFANTIKAIELGAYSVDASVFGMGRGAGNLPVELLLKYLNKDNSEYLELIKKYYVGLRKKYDWGYNYETLICGLENIHPSKVKAIV